MSNDRRLTIAVLIGDNYTEYANELIKGFYTCAKKEQVNLVFVMRSSIPRDTNAILSDMTGEDFQLYFSSIYDYVPLFKPDALILAYGSLSIFSDTPEKELLLEYFKDIPCLLLKDISDNPKVPHLVADNYSGMYETVRHLIVEHGYKKIAFLSGPKTNHDANERLRAYRDAMKQYGLPVTDSMIGYGDYSEFVDRQVNDLLDNNPGLEAIAFANDNMAKAGYRACEERRLVVGRDLAITGFDDVNFAKTLNPPLTSVMHNSYLFSYQALQNAIQLAKGEAAPYDKLPTILHTRSSCGCNILYEEEKHKKASKEEIILFIHENIERMVEDFFFSMPYGEEKEEYKNLLIFFFSDLTEHIFDNKLDSYTFRSQFPFLKQLCEHPRIAPLVMLDHVVQLLRKLIPFAEDERMRSSILRVISSTQQYVHSNVILSMQTTNQLSQHQSWFINTFTQDLLVSDLPLEEGLQRIMKRLYLMNVQSCYLFLLSEPAEYEKSFRLEKPENLYLAAYYNENTMKVMEKGEELAAGKNGIQDIISKERVHVFSTYVLFSENTQYGVLLCENAPEDILFVLACSLRIGSFLRFYNLTLKERDMRRELETSLQRIKEQNSILNFISEYDELTKLLNRRGFMEKTLHAISENAGRDAYILFGDLDHLKEINDSFGHSAGDFAIQTVAEYLNRCLPKDAIIGRIGGDEYVAFMISDDENFAETTKNTIKEYSRIFNEKSDQPFYVELSVGIYKSKCESTNQLTELLQKSDSLLYKEKANRRSSAKKAERNE